MTTYYLTDRADDIGDGYGPDIYICDGCQRDWCHQKNHKFCPSCGEKLDEKRPARLSHMPRGWWKKYGARWTEIHDAPKFDYDEYKKIPSWENTNRYTQPEWKIEWTITEYMDTHGSRWRDQYIDFSNDTTEELSPKTLRERASKELREAIRTDPPYSPLTYRITYGTQTKLIHVKGGGER